MHEIVNMGFIALEGSITEDFRIQKFSHFRNIGRIIENQLQEALLVLMVPIKIILFLGVAL